MILASLRLQNKKRERKKLISDGEGEIERYEEMREDEDGLTRKRKIGLLFAHGCPEEVEDDDCPRAFWARRDTRVSTIRSSAE